MYLSVPVATSVEVEAVRESFARRTDVLRKQDGDQTFCTTKEVLAEEAEILAFAREGRGAAAPLAQKPIRLERLITLAMELLEGKN